MGRTGNGTNANQWLYVMMHFPFFWKWKPGITGFLRKRTKQNSKGVFGFYIPVGFVKIPFAYPIEQFILTSSKGLRRQILGKGGREIRPWYIGILTLLFIYFLGIVKWTAPFAAAYGVGYLGEN